MADNVLNPMRESAQDFASSSYGAGDGGRPRTLEREVLDTRTRIGIGTMNHHDSRKFPFDYLKGSDHSHKISAGSASELSKEDALPLLVKVLDQYNLGVQDEHFKRAFVDALFLCMAINQTSQLLPTERAKFYVDGVPYDMTLAYSQLGLNLRRFARAYATEIVQVTRRALEDVSNEDPESVSIYTTIKRLAEKRNVTRGPYLISDVAEYAGGLSTEERAIAMLGVHAGVGGTSNAVDSRRLGAPVTSLDNYDSSNFRSRSGGTQHSASSSTGLYRE